MKRIIFILLITLATTQIHAQNVKFNWVKQIGAAAAQTVGNSITTDTSGNVYTTGFSNASMFISKFNAAGNLIWERQIGSTAGSADGCSITVDASGNVYTIGTFSGTVDFDPGPGVFNLTTTGSTFIYKLDAAGNFVWAKKIEIGNLIARGFLIAVDASENVYTTGTFFGTVDFDPGPGTFNLSSILRSVYVSKLDAGGNFIWARQMGGVGNTDEATSYSMAADASGNIYTTGSFIGTVDFDPGAGIYNLSCSSENIFVSKLDADGNFIWAKQMGATGNGEGFSIAVDDLGNVYTTGYFTGTIDFDPGAGVFNLSSAGNEDIFVCKLDANGNFIWARQKGGKGADQGYSIVVDASGNLYVTGYFNNTVDFDPGACMFNLTSAGDRDIFIFKLDDAGNFVWAKQIGGTGADIGFSIAADARGNVYTTGYFTGTVDFDPGTGVYNLSSFGAYDFFVHKLSPCTNSTSSTIIVSTCRAYALNCRTYTSSGVYTQILTNVAGCDSIVTLDLTITHTSSTVAAAAVACNSYLWNGQTYTTSGTYNDTLIAADGCDSIVTLQLTIKATSSTNIVKTICGGQSYLGYTNSGTYVDTLVATNGCDSLRTLQLSVQEKTVPDLGADKNLCSGDTLILYPGKFNTYLWQDGSTQSHFTATQPGLYSVVVTDNCSSARDEIILTQNTCLIYFPTSFTPNNDGINDVFRILDATNLNDYTLTIYNRWGQKIFETTDYTKGWDGSVNGQLAETGVYVWFCKFKKSNSSQNIEMKGTILLIR